MANVNPVYLFDDNPPVPELVRALFCNREQELSLGMSLLRAATSFRRIAAIHGLTRTGKSHYALRLLAEAQAEGLPYTVFEINANNRGWARKILEELFFQLWKAITTIPREEIPADCPRVFEDYCADLEHQRRLVNEYVEIAREEARGTTTTGGIEAGLKPGIASLGISAKVEDRENFAEKRIARGYSDHDLVDVVRGQLDALACFRPGRTVVLFVDDLDLLDRRGKEGQEECNKLVDLLRPLADHAHTMVLVTVRQRYFNGREKEFYEFANVKLLGPEVLRAVYAKHIEHFNGGREIFTADALDWVMRSSEGKVGIFLKRSRDLWRAYLPEEGHRIDVVQIKKYLATELDEMRHNPECLLHLVAVEQAVQGGRLEVTLGGELRDSPLLFTVLTPVSNQEGVYRIDAMFAEVIREARG